MHYEPEWISCNYATYCKKEDENYLTKRVVIIPDYAQGLINSIKFFDSQKGKTYMNDPEHYTYYYAVYEHLTVLCSENTYEFYKSLPGHRRKIDRSAIKFAKEICEEFKKIV